MSAKVFDILGFSQFWDSRQWKALHALGELIGAIYRTGTRVYSDQGERLFVHHPNTALFPGDLLSFNFPVLSRLQASRRCNT